MTSKGNKSVFHTEQSRQNKSKYNRYTKENKRYRTHCSLSDTIEGGYDSVNQLYIFLA